MRNTENAKDYKFYVHFRQWLDENYATIDAETWQEIEHDDEIHDYMRQPGYVPTSPPLTSVQESPLLDSQYSPEL